MGCYCILKGVEQRTPSERTIDLQCLRFAQYSLFIPLAASKFSLAANRRKDEDEMWRMREQELAKERKRRHNHDDKYPKRRKTNDSSGKHWWQLVQRSQS